MPAWNKDHVFDVFRPASVATIMCVLAYNWVALRPNYDITRTKYTCKVMHAPINNMHDVHSGRGGGKEQDLWGRMNISVRVEIRALY
jgi:hypothetical protein